MSQVTRVPKASKAYTALPVKGSFGHPVVLIDNHDIHRAMLFTWLVVELDDGTQAPMAEGLRFGEEPFSLGQWITDQDVVSYVNGDPMDCRRENLVAEGRGSD